MSACNQCNFPGVAAPHVLGATYYQVPDIGDICAVCHDEWLKHDDYKPIVEVVEPSSPRASRFQPSPSPPGVLNQLVTYYRCALDGCINRCRYDSGYCGVHDITENDGQGKLVKMVVKKIQL